MSLRGALRAGLVTSLAFTLLVLVMVLAWDVLDLVWPLAFVPLFLTGAFAVHQARATSVRAAAVAGALAGLVAGIVSTLAVSLVSYLGRPGTGLPYPYWNLFPTLTEPPFGLSGDVVLFDLPFTLPFPWFFQRRLPDGTILNSRLPWTYVLFTPTGVVLAALHAWLYQVLRRAEIAERAGDRIARVRAAFRSKLFAGFAILTVMIFVAGWLGFASTEEMHSQVHRGRAMQHWLEHALRIEADLRVQEEGLARLVATRDEAVIRELTAAGQRVTAELAHIRTVPPPVHRAFFVGVDVLRTEAERRLPQAREAESRYKDLAVATAELVELYRAGRTAEAEARLNALASTRRAVLAPLRELVGALNRDLVTWGAEADAGSHGQQIAAMLLLLAATGIAFPLGAAFARVVVRPVTRVAEGLERIGRGDFAYEVQVPNRDELGELARRVNATSDELARLYAELRSLNENLQQRVDQAVREIERSRMLRRYLPHQVADAVIASGDESLLQTHRREITVIFGDLRGFTAFAETGEPEVVMRVIGEYHDAIGELISRFGGTLEHFAGDGVMVYFNDPLPQDDHAARSVRMAVAVRERVGELAKTWRRLGFELDFGVGIAIGYATLGTIGFAGRHDYGAIGSVANLASRLSDEAAGGQILLSQRVYALVEELVEAEPVGALALKGFSRPVPAYNVVALKEMPTQVA